MLKRNVSSRWYIIAGLILVSFFLQDAVTAAEYGTNTTDEGMEVLTRGPIHEAFAEVSVDEAKPELVISRSVPEPINEVPPDYRPEGDNVQWIPGYWSWDEDQNDFIWVSGVWRDVPPGRQWITGHWITAAGGNQYVSGYWAESNQAETVYLPPPPEPPATAPGVPVSSADNVWVDGHWLWSHNGYVWQAGYWLRQRPEMAWTPSHYVWTPRGYIFVRGYWDYQLVRRGVMFAPRYYSRPIYRERDYYYTPSIVLDTDAIFLSLFIRPHHRHYYFGDYHDVRYERRGYVPWYSNHATRHGHDPYYRSYRWYNSRHDDRWEHNYRQQFEYRRNHREARPPVRYRQQVDHDFARSHGEKHKMLGRPYADVVKKNDRDVRFTRTRSDDKRDYREYGRKGTPAKVERREGEVTPERKEKTWKKSVNNPQEQKNRAAASDKGNVNQANYPERQQRGVKDSPPVNPYQQNQKQLHDNRSGSQLQPKTWRTGNDQPRIDQRQRELQKKGRQPDFSSHSNQLKRTDPQKENRTAHQPSKNKVERQPITAERKKDSQRQVKQEKSLAAQGQDLRNDPSQVRIKGKRPVDPEVQTAGQGGVMQVDGQIIRRPRSAWDQRGDRSSEK